MSEEHSTSKSIFVGIGIGILVLIVMAVVYSVLNPTPIEQLISLITGTQQQVENVSEEVTDSRQEVLDTAQQEAEDIVQAILDIDNPAARFALVKTYIDELRTLLTPASRNDLDAIIVYVERNPVVLVEPDTLPATFSASLETIRQELSKASGSATATYQQVTDSVASPSAASPTPVAVVGQEYTLTGMLSLVETDPLLGGTYFVMTETNYGEPFYLYLTGSQVATVKDTMVGEIVTVRVEVTSIEDGFVRYTVLAGPVLGTTISSTSASPSARPTSSVKAAIESSSEAELAE